jgi:hypothetical protein
VDGAGRRMGAEDVRRHYSGAANTEVLADAPWDPASLLRI